MSRLVMWNMISLDGFYDGEKAWELGWHASAWGEELERHSLEQLHDADRLLFGRVTYEGMASYWTSAEGEVGEIADLMNGLPKVVVSRTLERADWNNTTLVKGDVVAEIAKLKGEGDRSTYVFGSGNISETLLRHGLFDEIRLCISPVILGSGRTLFGRGLDFAKLQLLEARPLATGAVVLRYEPSAAEDGRR